MGIALCIIGFLSAYLGGRASLGLGASAVLGVGYFYGIFRARYIGVFSHFSFDCALLGLYLARFTMPRQVSFPASAREILGWLAVLVGWPVVVLATGFMHDRHVFVQIVGFRAVVWMLPCLCLGATMDSSDLRTLARAVALLNLAVLPFAVGEYFWGIEPFFPRSPVTAIMYMSKDIAGHTAYRIPGTFVASAMYGAVMLGTVPLLFGLLQAAGNNFSDRVLAIGGLLAAAYGIFACGSRSPAAHLILLTVPALLAMRRRAGMLALTVGLVAMVAYYVSQDIRLQRVKQLEDPEMVLARLQGSANASAVDLVAKYPLGVGLGGAAGTSMPSFLAKFAKGQIGAENEYVRLGLELGVVGLSLWFAFLFWYLFRRRIAVAPEWQLGCTLMFFYTVIVWATAFIGTGMLTSIPGTMLLLLQMGCVARSPVRARTARPVSVLETFTQPRSPGAPLPVGVS